MSEPITLDVRDELREGGEPLPRILRAVGSLAPGQALRLLVTFEPLPLYAVLGRRGFEHRAVRHGEGDWEVLFSPQTPQPEISSPAHPSATVSSTDGWPPPSASLDNRGLEPPEPMIRILDALEHLGAGQVLEALNERDPVFLYPQLQARGAAIHIEKVGEGVRLLIRQRG
ncbi:MAG: DUF2249 domain-containing protein [Steroidobacteraceae bacterium]|jgi:uncharacterized protein (DUF2249 family)